MPKEPRREQAITYRPLTGGIGLGLPTAGLGISLGLGGVQPAAPTGSAPAIDGGNPRGGVDEAPMRIGGAATRQEILPVTDAGLGDDFIDFDDDPELPADAIHELPLVNARNASDDDDDGEGEEDVFDAWADDVDDDPNADPRWCPPGTAARLARVRSPLIRLHHEIVDFCRYLEPTAEESSARTAAVERVRGAVLSIWPGARFEVHGSFATGMYLPNSDIDAVILGSGCKSPATCLKALALSLSRKGMARKIQLIAKARVPIVKFEERPSGFQFDVSFDVANGPASAEIVRANMRRFPALRPLTTVLKAFLQQRALNEVYTGGVGSYALLCMVMAHLQLHDSKETAYSWAGDAGGEAAAEGCLGVLLIDFFELYGRRLNMEEVGVSCRGGGAFFAKKDKTWSDPGRPFLLAIEDPQDRSGKKLIRREADQVRVRARVYAHDRASGEQEGVSPAEDCPNGPEGDTEAEAAGGTRGDRRRVGGFPAVHEQTVRGGAGQARRKGEGNEEEEGGEDAAARYAGGGIVFIGV